MSRWFRHYAGMMRDEKLVRAALRAKQPIERIMWVWGAILESAAELNDNGRYDLDAAEVAYFLRADEADICAVLDALAASGRVAEGIVVNWSARQFQSDRSATRQAAHRERKRSERSDSDDRPQDSDGDVTAVSRHGDAPETETETETEPKKKEPSLRSGRARATRIPDDWRPNVEEAKAEGLTERDIQAQSAVFRDYWRAKAGKDGTKLDWPATWRNWCRRFAEERGRMPQGPAPPAAPKHGDVQPDGSVYLQADTPEYDAWCAFEREQGRKNPPRHFHGGWKFPSRWPPGYEKAA
jgi:hypothetical protein